jgi:dTDP-4-amino-4,6-dideoxygalactose transaminase
MSATRVPLLDLRRVDADLDQELTDAFKRCLVSGHYILGPEVDAFEAECAEYLGCKHAIGVSSGTDALLLALMALGVGAGDEVICPTHTFFATAGTIWRTGARPVFVDCRLDSFNLDSRDLAARISPRTKAVVPVHLFGRMADMDAVLAAAENVPVIEDAAQAFGAASGRHRAGRAGAYGCFSFFPSKNLGALGDAGLLTCEDDRLAKTARLLRAHGGQPKYHHAVVGGNFRIDALQAALLRQKLPRLDRWTEQRQANARRYTELFDRTGIAAPNRGQTAPDGAAIWYPLAGPDRDIYNQYCIRVPEAGQRDALKAFLQEHGVGSEIYYPVPMHLQQCFASLGYRAGEFPFSERAAAESLALPIFPELRESEIEFVVGRIAAFFHSGA